LLATVLAAELSQSRDGDALRLEPRRARAAWTEAPLLDEGEAGEAWPGIGVSRFEADVGGSSWE
jgi:hypothetical protein